MEAEIRGRTVVVDRRRLVVGDYILLTGHGEGYHDGPKHLYLLNRDFKDVLFMVRWPERWWPK